MTLNSAGSPRSGMSRRQSSAGSNPATANPIANAYCPNVLLPVSISVSATHAQAIPMINSASSGDSSRACSSVIHQASASIAIAATIITPKPRLQAFVVKLNFRSMTQAIVASAKTQIVTTHRGCHDIADNTPAMIATTAIQGSQALASVGVVSGHVQCAE